MSKFTLEPPPPYVNCSPEEWKAAKEAVARKQMTPFFAQAAGFRRSALRAALNSGAWIKPEIAVEFKSTIDAIGYRPHRRPNIAEHHAEEARKIKATTGYAELVKKAREALPTQFVSTQQARAFLGPIGFAHFAQTFEGQALQKLENDGHENRFHGR
jgi:hypothetical protein